SAQERVDSEAVRLVSIVDSRLIAEEQITSEILRDQVEEGRYAVVRLRNRPPIEIGSRPGGDVIKATERGEAGESVTVEEPRSEVTREVGRTLMIIGLVALLAIIAAALLAIRQGNRLAAPLTDLAETAER
ncbi:two-component sensor histidine kinase, partial [Streptomyces sp. SID11233]|nr:two-component sensor histidine kinase [Streptomyces sp. SID11233]